MEEAKKEGKVTEEELENVAGGNAEADARYEQWRIQAKAEGRPVLVEANRDGTKFCIYCKAIKSIYAREKWDIKHGFDEYRDCKCYCCVRDLGNLNTIGYQVD